MKTTVTKKGVQTHLLKTGLDKVFWEHIPVKEVEAFQHYSKNKLFIWIKW